MMELAVSRTVLLLVGGAVIFAGCAGCTVPTSNMPLGSDTLNASEPPLGAIPIISSPSQVELPVYSYLPSVEQSVSIMTSYTSLINECLYNEASPRQVEWEKFNIEDITMSTGVATTADLATFVGQDRMMNMTQNSMWNFFNPDTVAHDGYRAPSDTMQVSIVFGVDDPAVDSCVARVNSVLPAGVASGIFGLFSLPDGGPTWHPEDSRYVAAEAKWSACMTEHGFAYRTSYDATAANYRTSDAPESKAVAVADVQCKIDTNLVGVAVAVQSAYEQEYIDRHRDALAAQQKDIAVFLSGDFTVPEEAPPSQEPSMAESAVGVRSLDSGSQPGSAAT